MTTQSPESGGKASKGIRGNFKEQFEISQ